MQKYRTARYRPESSEGTQVTYALYYIFLMYTV